MLKSTKRNLEKVKVNQFKRILLGVYGFWWKFMFQKVSSNNLAMYMCLTKMKLQRLQRNSNR